MTITVRDIIHRAHMKLGVVQRGEEVSADYADEALFAFNEMVHGWKRAGIEVMINDAAFTDRALNDDFPMADEFREGAIYLLASRLSPEYLLPPAFDENAYMASLQSSYVTIPTLSIPAAVSNPPSELDEHGHVVSSAPIGVA